MKKIIKLTESDVTNLVKKVLEEQISLPGYAGGMIDFGPVGGPSEKNRKTFQCILKNATRLNLSVPESCERYFLQGTIAPSDRVTMSKCLNDVKQKTTTEASKLEGMIKFCVRKHNEENPTPEPPKPPVEKGDKVGRTVACVRKKLGTLPSSCTVGVIKIDEKDDLKQYMACFMDLASTKGPTAITTVKECARENGLDFGF